MTSEKRPCQSNFAAQLWADVGGTFTDCFIVIGDERRLMKVLTSGVVRGELVSAIDGNLVVAKLTHPTPAHFWNGATIRLIQNGLCLHEAIVTHQSPDGRYGFDQAIPAEFRDSGFCDAVVELDPNLEAPVLAAHLLLGIPLAQSLPAIDIRLGTTRGTNALLTRRGANVGLITTLGFGDCLEIGEQNRPDLFALEIQKTEPLTRHVIEADERLTASGEVLRTLDADSLLSPLRRWKEAGVTSIAICLLHSHVNDVHERIVAEVAKQVGFTQISVSSQVAPMIKLVSRAETTVLDAYLTPILSQYVARLESQFHRGGATGQQSDAPRSRLRLMTSAGNLVDAESFRGGDSILSGPAGGVVALGKIADADAPEGVIGLDMGGTSTDVCRYAGKIPRDYESRKAGVRVLTPMMSIHTIAAGGGSICDVVDSRMIVGPQSAGAMPGPACYGRGGPLTVTDLNVILGRLPKDCFPFPLNIDAAGQRLREVNAKLGEAAFENDEDAAEGFFFIAITHMAEAVRTVSTAQGSDPRDFTLVGFGGAAGGHVCAVAEAIGMKRIFDHGDASLLSALGIGLADVGRIRSRGVYQNLEEIDGDQWKLLVRSIRDDAIDALATEAESSIGSEFSAQVQIETDLRYQGTEATLSLVVEPSDTLAARFHEAHHTAFGYDQWERNIEVATIRCEATIASTESMECSSASRRPLPLAASERSKTAAFHFGGKRHEVPLLVRHDVLAGTSLEGPCIVVDENSTLVIELGWTATKGPSGSFALVRKSSESLQSSVVEQQADLVTIEVVARRMQGIADSMGELLRRTAASVNIRQRLDYSCAIFTSDGGLIANAPHVPVHLGAMGHTVREIRTAFPTMSAGDVYVSNNPYAGGSHLPDVTVVTPMFCDSSRAAQSGLPDYYVASRAHHAEIGGKTPGSMPPDAKCLGEEGVVIDTFALKRDGKESLRELRKILSSGPFPSRDPETNMADIAAQRAAGVLGVRLLQQMTTSMGLGRVQRCVETLFDLADGLVARWIDSLSPEAMAFRDTLDDGTVINVQLRVLDKRLVIDFAGTSPVHPGCFNATPAIVTAATIYVLRCVIGGTLPMNDGIMRRIDLRLPIGLLNPPHGETSFSSPAVVAGNVETSMRVVDCLLGALGLVAASQGTMNNVLIGNETFGYYETIGGGAGAGPNRDGASGVHTHMTNTRITDPEIYESRYPVRLWRFAIREGSGGEGLHRGGNGMIREIEFLQPLSLAMITNRRGDHRPWGMKGGGDASAGENLLVKVSGETVNLPAAVTRHVQPHERLIIKTPGGGGYGVA